MFNTVTPDRAMSEGSPRMMIIIFLVLIHGGGGGGGGGGVGVDWEHLGGQFFTWAHKNGQN